MAKVIIACVGGFLGAGKTTAIVSAARELMGRGFRVGIITNDQGAELVDTKVMQHEDVPTREIGGGCFCCKFDDLVVQAEQIIGESQPDIILAEAVGSCTDLSATVYQPLRKYYGERFNLAPLSVLVEPARIRNLLTECDDGFPESVRYLFKKQLAEADLIVLNKVETLSALEAADIMADLRTVAGNIPIHRVSAMTREGVADWIEILLSGSRAGLRTLDIDYEIYGRAEASLGWLNANVEISASKDCSPREFAADLMSRIQVGVVSMGMTIAHVKILVATETETDRLAITSNDGSPEWSGRGLIPHAHGFSVVINARVHSDPQKLAELISNSLTSSARRLDVDFKVDHLESFSPPQPRPRHRIATVTT